MTDRDKLTIAYDQAMAKIARLEDEIERLRAAEEQWQQAAAGWATDRQKFKDKIERLRAETAHLEEQITSSGIKWVVKK